MHYTQVFLVFLVVNQLAIKSLIPLLKIFARSWNQNKYQAGGDGHGREAQARVAEEREQRQTIAQFSPSLLTETLQSSLFYYFAIMCVRVENVPPSLARKCEVCPCHVALLKDKTEHQKEQIMQRHYGLGVKSCPAAGMTLLELVAGLLDDSVRELWKDLEA